MLRRFVSALAASGLAVSLATPALADGPLSLYGGAQFGTSDTGIAKNTPRTDLGLGYDFGPKTIVPIRARFDLDDAFANGAAGRVGILGAGVSARLTTPFYVGAGLALYNVDVRTPLAGGGSTAASATGFGTNLFIGSKIFSLPGAGVAIEGGYEAVPKVDGRSFNSFGAGLRVSI